MTFEEWWASLGYRADPPKRTQLATGKVFAKLAWDAAVSAHSPPAGQSAAPSAGEVHLAIGRLLRELHVARRLLKVAELADQYRGIEARAVAKAEGGAK